ncbi:MAG: M20/M25/M40 family metallo-hydrolase [Paracoccaceae bacterium]|nr:M20/M25/M40 family metallo-hydrolase [Paracoccaceae bacterium]
MQLDPVLARIDADLENSVHRLLELLRIPSISTDPAFAQNCDIAADWLVCDIESLGATAEKYPTLGHPMVVGHIKPPNSDSLPHILFYGHYDVQPVDPIELWNKDPFDPQLEDTANGRVIRGRGSSDDKGQLMTFVEACRAWKTVHGSLPCKITFFFEGEEESGSPSLVPFLRENKAELTSDIILICDTTLFQSKTPTIVTRLRGMLKEEITVIGPDKDLHSGLYGGVAINPIRVLSKILGSLHDDSGRVTVPNFYDGVPDLPDDVDAQWQELNFNHATFLRDVGLSVPAGEKEFSPLEMIWSRPTCEINGIQGGYTGEGFKTVLPSQASTKVSFRLVGDQDPFAIRKSLHAYVRDMLPYDCQVRFHDHEASSGLVMSTEAPEFEAARQALSAEWPDDAAFIGCGGSIPIAGHFQDIIGVTPILIGFGKDDDQLHSPNEKYDLESFHKGTRSWAHVLDALAR